jgi:hypothetical protein
LRDPVTPGGNPEERSVQDDRGPSANQQANADAASKTSGSELRTAIQEPVMIYVKSAVAGVLALVVSLSVWLIAINLDFPSAPVPPPAPSRPSTNLVSDRSVSTWTSAPDWPFLGIAVLAFASGFYLQFRRNRRLPESR